jgi:hypothetical protein
MEAWLRGSAPQLDNSVSAPPYGYVYVPRDEPGLMADAKPGQRLEVRGPRPPWIVVNHGLESVIIARWPGSLWKVEITRALSARELAALRAYQLVPNAGYTRAAVVTVLEQMPLTAFFGFHGAEVCTVIDAVDALTLERATQLAGARHPQAGQAYTRTWHAWLTEKHPGFLRANRERREVRLVAERSKFSPPVPGAELDGTLEAGSHSASPIAQGLALVSGQGSRRAGALMGKSVWSDDPDDPEGALLAEPWPAAIQTLLDAALAFGAPEYVAEPDLPVLLKAWREVVGADPA